MTEYLMSIGMYEKRTKEKEIPGFVFFENDEFRKEFVRHLFSTDGSISIQRKKKTVISITYTSTSYMLIFGLQLLLQSLGILSTILKVTQGTKKFMSGTLCQYTQTILL